MKNPPNWQTSFRNLPEIPEHKRWNGKSNMTLEQIIAFKLLHKQPITKNEEEIFTDLATFYSELNDKLINLDYSLFNPSDFDNFKNYIFYAFNYTALISNKLTILQTYRLVVNEWVCGKNERIRNIDFIKYPSLDIVKKANKLNRANTLNTNVFYSAQNIDTSLMELRPPLNKLITVGVWKPKSNKEFISYPISHSEEAAKVNEGVAKAKSAFDDHENFNSALFLNYTRYYFELFGREFTKRVTNHYEYLISALFSESIFENQGNSNTDVNYDCIIYPSVGNGYKTDNLAMRPTVLDNDFYLEKVIEFEVEHEFYDKPYVLTHPENITLAKIKNVYITNKFDKGEIIW